MSGHRWFDLPIRILISLGLIYSTYLVARRGVAEWYFRQPSVESVRKALEWHPKNPMYQAGLARVLQQSLEGDRGEVIRLYEQAVLLSPYQASYWAELGGAYETAERLDDARRAYEQAQKLFPNSPEINWQLANFYVRQGQVDLTLEALQKVLLGDPALRTPALDLVWRAGIEPKVIRERMLPADVSLLFYYLNYLTGRDQLEEAHHIWARILDLKQPFDPRPAFPYLDALIRGKQVEELRIAWGALSERNPVLIRQRAFEANLATNGDFESEILNAGLDWRITPVEGVVVSVDNLTFFDGTRSLKIQFDGRHNVAYWHVYQYLPVEPNTLYRFMGYMRAQGITTDSGLRFELSDAYDPSALSLSTENLVGTSGWTPQHLEFQTGPDTRLLIVRVARPASRKFDNQIAGTVWIDRVSLNAVE